MTRHVYLRALAETGCYLEFDQGLRTAGQGADSFTIRAIADLVSRGHWDRIVVGTDGARRSLWTTLGGSPGLAWLASALPGLLAEHGLDADVVHAIMAANGERAFSWYPVG